MAVLPADSIAKAFQTAFSSRGISITRHHLAIREEQGLMKFCMRLGRAKNPLPTREYLDEQSPKGKLKPGSVAGAHYLLLGAVQSPGGPIRVTTRIVSVETSVILSAGKADAGGEGGLAQAVDSALTQLETQFGPAG